MGRYRRRLDDDDWNGPFGFANRIRVGAGGAMYGLGKFIEYAGKEWVAPTAAGGLAATDAPRLRGSKRKWEGDFSSANVKQKNSLFITQSNDVLPQFMNKKSIGADMSSVVKHGGGGGGRLFTKNNRRRRYKDKLSFAMLKNIYCPRWNLKVHLARQDIIGAAGLQTIREHTYFTAADINGFILKAKDIYAAQLGHSDMTAPAVINSLAGQDGLSITPGVRNGTTSVKCCMMSYTQSETFTNHSTGTVFMNLWEVVPVTPQINHFVTAWKAGLGELYPIAQGTQSLIASNEVVGPETVSNDVLTTIDAAVNDSGSGLTYAFTGAVSGTVAADRLFIPRQQPPWNTFALRGRFKCISKKYVVLGPGQSYTHVMTFKPFAIDQLWYNNIANISPFRTRKLITACWGELGAVQTGDISALSTANQAIMTERTSFMATAPFQVGRVYKTFGQFRAMPYQKNIVDITIGSGSLNPERAPNKFLDYLGAEATISSVKIIDESENAMEVAGLGG